MDIPEEKKLLMNELGVIMPVEHNKDIKESIKQLKNIAQELNTIADELNTLNRMLRPRR